MRILSAALCSHFSQQSCESFLSWDESGGGPGQLVVEAGRAPHRAAGVAAGVGL